jgi:tRNA-dihydrouridine synthase B
MRFEPDEHPFGIQLFGSEPESMGIAAGIAAEGKPDVIDINFGCPVKKVVCRGKGAAVLKDPARAAAVTAACVAAVDVPVTVKVRIGQDPTTINILDVVRALEDAGAAAVTIHGRTVAQMFSGAADWDVIAEVKRRAGIPIIGNGDIATAEDAYRRLNECGVDAVMIGRAALGNPFVFRQIREYLDTGVRPPPPTLADKVGMAIRHAELQVEELGERTGILTLRKQLTWYTKGMPDSARLRERLFATERLDEVRSLLMEYLASRGAADGPALEAEASDESLAVA